MKKLLAIVLSMVLCISLFAGCGGSSAPAETKAPETEAPATEAPAETEVPTEAPTEAPADPMALEGIYYFGYPVDGLGSLVQFYHFYPDTLGIGNVFYAGYAWNQITFSGTWTIAEEPCDYEALPGRGDDVTPVTGTAPYTVHLFGWDGTELDKVAYDGEVVYNISENTNCGAATGGGNYVLTKADEAALAEYADTFDGELGIAYKNFVDPADASCTVQLNTNGTYSDLVLFAVDGTWAMTAEGEYTLTPNDASDNGAVMTEQEDGSFLYVSADGTEATLEEVKEAAVAYTFAGKTPFMDNEADVTIRAYSDGTCDVVMAAFGMEMVIDEGTYTFEEPAIFTFTFTGAGEIVSEFGGETGVQVTYTCESVAAIGGAGVEAVCGVVLG